MRPALFSLAANFLVRKTRMSGPRCVFAIRTATLIADGLVLSGAFSLAATYGSLASLAVGVLFLTGAALRAP